MYGTQTGGQSSTVREVVQGRDRRSAQELTGPERDEAAADEEEDELDEDDYGVSSMIAQYNNDEARRRRRGAPAERTRLWLPPFIRGSMSGVCSGQEEDSEGGDGAFVAIGNVNPDDEEDAGSDEETDSVSAARMEAANRRLALVKQQASALAYQDERAEAEEWEDESDSDGSGDVSMQGEDDDSEDPEDSDEDSEDSEDSDSGASSGSGPVGVRQSKRLRVASDSDEDM